MSGRLYVTIVFSDESTKDFSMPNVLDKPWGRAFVDKCTESLLNRLNTYGKEAGVPGEDLRHYNGNFATGAGRDPGPCGARKLTEWTN